MEHTHEDVAAMRKRTGRELTVTVDGTTFTGSRKLGDYHLTVVTWRAEAPTLDDAQKLVAKLPLWQSFRRRAYHFPQREDGTVEIEVEDVEQVPSFDDGIVAWFRALTAKLTDGQITKAVITVGPLSGGKARLVCELEVEGPRPGPSTSEQVSQPAESVDRAIQMAKLLRNILAAGGW